MSGVALVVTDRWRQNVRVRPSERETFALGQAFADGDFTGERRCAWNARKLLPQNTPDEWLTYPGLQYATIRDYLIHEHDADPRIAASVALRLTAPLRSLE